MIREFHGAARRGQTFRAAYFAWLDEIFRETEVPRA